MTEEYINFEDRFKKQIKYMKKHNIGENHFCITEMIDDTEVKISVRIKNDKFNK